MSQREEQNLFFLSLPDLRKLLCVTLAVPGNFDDGELRNVQVNSCRHINAFDPDANELAVTFFKSGIIQAYTQSHGLQMGVPQRVLPSYLQLCLSYTLTVRLAPNWNKVGQFLVAGMNFLSCSGRLNAVVMQVSVSESQLCISVEANSVRLPPTSLEDFDIAPNVIRKFHGSRDAVIHSPSVPSNWCYVLPSMKRGQIMSISHQMPAECPFQSYAEIQKHWSSLYGYKLPPVEEQDMVYCSVYFKPIGERLFSYPFSCIRAHPIQCFPRFDLQGAVSSFVSDVRGKLQNVCGFPLRMTSKPCYPTASLTTPASQGFSGKPVNLTTKSACRPVLTQLPPSIHQNGTVRTATVELFPSLQGGRSNMANCSGGGTSPAIPLINAPPINRPKPIHSSATMATPVHRIVPVFRNKVLDRHVNVTKILAERRQQREGEGRRHLETCSGPTPGPASSFKRKWDVPSGVRRAQLGPSTLGREENLSCKQGCRSEGAERVPEPRESVPRSPAISTGGDWFQSKPKKPKVSVVDVDVERYARSQQLSKINAATLQAWLRGRGVPVRSKAKREELVTKVMLCLSEP